MRTPPLRYIALSCSLLTACGPGSTQASAPDSSTSAFPDGFPRPDASASIGEDANSGVDAGLDEDSGTTSADSGPLADGSSAGPDAGRISDAGHPLKDADGGAGSCSTGNTLFNGVCVPTDDFTLWVQPYLGNIEQVRRILMTPYVLAKGHYGYDSTFGLVRGANIEPSPAIGITSPNNDAIVLIDNNLEGSASLDFWNSYKGVASTVEANCRHFLDATSFDEIGTNCPPFPQMTYDGTDRREAKLGKHSPYYGMLSKPGQQIHNTSGQTDFVPGYEGINGSKASCSAPPTLQTNLANPIVVTALPIDSPINGGGNLETDGPWISLQFEQGNVSVAHGEFAKVVGAWDGNTFGSYGSATRDLLHFIHCARATGFWRDATITGPKGTAQEVVQQVVALVWQIQASGGDGGLTQCYSGTAGCGSTDTPEPNFQAMIAFDPRVPTWF
jgi:hypothetical protein